MSSVPTGAVLLEAHAKLTWRLDVVGVRDDGYHLIEAEMVTLDLADLVEIHPGEVGCEVVGADGGLPVTTGDDNSVRRALDLVGCTARVRLHKRIPAGAGLGGGSADAAAVLRWAGLSDPATALALGADVPFCLVGGRARVSGVGEVVEPLPFEPRTVTLAIPPFGCSTPAVYRMWDEMGGPRGGGPNDLEEAALAVEPRLARWRDALASATGEVPVLAGSGSTWFVTGAHPGDGRIVARAVPGSS